MRHLRRLCVGFAYALGILMCILFVVGILIVVANFKAIVFVLCVLIFLYLTGWQLEVNNSTDNKEEQE